MAINQYGCAWLPNSYFNTPEFYVSFFLYLILIARVQFRIFYCCITNAKPFMNVFVYAVLRVCSRYAFRGRSEGNISVGAAA